VTDEIGKENKVSRDEKLGFLATVQSLPSARSIESVLRLSIVSSNLCFLPKPAGPMKVKTKNTPIQDMNFSEARQGPGLLSEISKPWIGP